MLTHAGAVSAQPQAGALVRLRYATFDPLRNPPQVDPELRIPLMQNDEGGQFILQFQGPVRPEWVAAVRAQGIKLEDYIPDYAFLAQMTLRQAATLPMRFAFVRWVGAFHPAYKIDPQLTAAKQPSEATVVTFAGANTQLLANQIAITGTPVLDATADTLHITANSAVAIRVAKMPAVKWVSALAPVSIANDRSAAVMGAAGGTGVRPQGLFGKGQTVCVADTGLDTGNEATLNADFQGRLVKAIGISDPKNWSDANGHGTHVAGSVLGAGANSGSDPTRHDYDRSFAGVAPEAGLVIQSLGPDPYGSLVTPADLNDLFAEPYSLGARVHTNSWRAYGNGGYSIRANQVDQFIYEHPDMVILFCAGNEGVDTDSDGVVDRYSIGDPSAAKNIICVGASEGNRPQSQRWGGYSQYLWGDLLQIKTPVTNPPTYVPVYPTAPISTDAISNNVNGMAAFSSRGPTLDGRIKPDVVAPGTDIISVWSRVAAKPYVLPTKPPTTIPPRTGWGTFSGAYTDANPRSKYLYEGGTSMSTPLTAGAAALVREYYEKQKWVPSAALVKATIINGAHDMNPGQYGAGAGQEMTKRPNPVEGWGRVDLANALFPAAPRKVMWFEGAKLQTGEYHRLAYNVKGAGEALRVTVVWTDPPGAPYAAKALVNDLNVQVTDPSGQVFWGNGANGGDTLNNVEQIDIDTPTPGDYVIRIDGANVPQGPQTYALVVSANGEPKGGRFPDIVPPQVKILSPSGSASVGGSVRITVNAVDDRGIDKVALWTTDSQGKKVRLGTRYAAPYVFTWNTAGWKRGTYTLEATANDFGRNTATDTVTLDVRGPR